MESFGLIGRQPTKKKQVNACIAYKNLPLKLWINSSKSRLAMPKAIPILTIQAFSQLHFSKEELIAPAREISQEDFLVQRLEESTAGLKLPLPPHRKTVFDFILVQKGRAERSFGLSTYTLKTNQIFLMPCNAITSTRFISEDIKGYYCHFSKKFLDGMLPYFDKLSVFERTVPVKASPSLDNFNSDN
ncbi:MAG: hypothetical protein ACXIT9_01230 [Nitritalea sp.]